MTLCVCLIPCSPQPAAHDATPPHTAHELAPPPSGTCKAELAKPPSLPPPSGTGKSELINALLERPAARTNCFRDSTKSVRRLKGSHHGIQLEIIDTPGEAHTRTRSCTSTHLRLEIIDTPGEAHTHVHKHTRTHL